MSASGIHRMQVGEELRGASLPRRLHGVHANPITRQRTRAGPVENAGAVPHDRWVRSRKCSHGRAARHRFEHHRPNVSVRLGKTNTSACGSATRVPRRSSCRRSVRRNARSSSARAGPSPTTHLVRRSSAGRPRCSFRPLRARRKGRSAARLRRCEIPAGKAPVSTPRDHIARFCEAAFARRR